jgi:hypothetical protein
MVILALTSSGLQQALHLPVDSSIAIWCGADAISESDYKTLARNGLSRFSHSLGNLTIEELSSELDTITEHHPNETIYIEHISQT